jgi:hypothetical protein
MVNDDGVFESGWPSLTASKGEHFTSAGTARATMIGARSEDPGEGSMFDQTIGGSLRSLAIGLVLTAAVVGAGFALAFS